MEIEVSKPKLNYGPNDPVQRRLTTVTGKRNEIMKVPPERTPVCRAKEGATQQTKTNWVYISPMAAVHARVSSSLVVPNEPGAKYTLSTNMNAQTQLGLKPEAPCICGA